MRRSRRLPLIVAVSIAVASMSVVTRAESAEFGYTVGGGIEHTDNVDLTPTKEKSDLIYILNGGYNYKDQSANLDVAAALAGQARLHRNVDQDNEFLGAAQIGVVWKPYPRLFHWVVDDTYTPTIDPQQSPSPSNIKHANVFSTGPDVFFHFGAVDTMNIGGRVVDARYEGNDGDNTATQGYVRWLHRTSERTTLSLNHDRQNVNYIDTADEDYNQTTNTAGLTFQSARDRFSANYGYSTIDRERQDTLRTNVGSASWDRFISGRTQFNIRFLRDLSDAGSDVVQQTQNQQNPGAVVVPNSTDVYLLREAAAQLRWGITPGTARASSIGVFWNDRNYQIDNNSDEQDQGVSLAVVWPFTALFYATATASYTERDFYHIRRRDDETVVGMGLNYLLTRRTTIGAYIRHDNNNSTSPADEYLENRIGIFVSYATTGGSRKRGESSQNSGTQSGGDSRQ